MMVTDVFKLASQFLLIPEAYGKFVVQIYLFWHPTRYIFAFQIRTKKVIEAGQVLLRRKISRSLQLQVTVRENVHRLQNDGGSKFNGRWNADENIWRTCMFLFFGGRIATILLASVSSHHFLFPYSISWECPDRRCTSQGGFPPSAVQTPVPLSGNEWSVGWSYRPASHFYSLDVGCFRRVETLSIRMGSSLHFRVWITFYIFVDTGSHERGQTSRPVVGAEI